MTFTLTIDTDNAAFTDEAASDEDRDDEAAACAEVARILRHLARFIASGQTVGAALDVYGNSVGRFELKL